MGENHFNSNNNHLLCYIIARERRKGVEKMEVKEMLAEKRVKRTAVDMSKLKADGLMVAAAYMQGLQAAVRLCEQQQQVVGQ